MAIFPKSLAAAQDAAAKAERTVSEWETKAAGVRSEASELDANSGALILDDPAQAEKISIKINSLERTARAYDSASSEARRKLNTAQGAAIEAEAVEEEKQAANEWKRANSLQSQVDSLKAQIEEIDGCTWERLQRTDVTGNQVGIEQGQAEHTRENAIGHDIRAAIIRFYLATSRVPGSFSEINKKIGTDFVSYNISGEMIPESVRAARDAGITFSRETADA